MERDRAVKPGPHSGLGTWAGARVAPLRCPILRPGKISCNVAESVQQLVMEFSKLPRDRLGWRSIYRRSRAHNAESWESCVRRKIIEEGLDSLRVTINIRRSEISAIRFCSMFVLGRF